MRGGAPAVRWAEPTDAARLRRAGLVWPEAVMKRKLEWREVALAPEGEICAGYLAYDHLWTTLPFLATIWVARERRGQGLGRRLLGLLEAEVRGRGGTRLYSSSQLDEPSAQAWHRRMGFAECGILAGHNEGGVGEVVFRKMLEP